MVVSDAASETTFEMGVSAAGDLWQLHSCSSVVRLKEFQLWLVADVWTASVLMLLVPNLLLVLGLHWYRFWGCYWYWEVNQTRMTPVYAVY